MKYTKYEKARMIGARTLQIAMGAPFMIDLNQDELKKLRYSPIEIAKLEFEKGIIPIEVKRPYPKLMNKDKISMKRSKENKINNKDVLSH